MKKMFVLLVACIGMFAIAIPANAQVSAKVAKAAGTLIKGSGKTKAATKIATPVRKTPSTNNGGKRYLQTTETCKACNGYGKVNVWNPYYGCYVTQECSECNGRGRVRKIKELFD